MGGGVSRGGGCGVAEKIESFPSGNSTTDWNASSCFLSFSNSACSCFSSNLSCAISVVCWHMGVVQLNGN